MTKPRIWWSPGQKLWIVTLCLNKNSGATHHYWCPTWSHAVGWVAYYYRELIVKC